MPRVPLTTVAALVTPSGRGAVASVIVRGPNASQVSSKWLRRPTGEELTNAVLDRIYFARWGQEPAEEVVLSLRQTADHSESTSAVEHLEIHCHGGRAASARILQDLASSGCQIIDWRSFVSAAEPDCIETTARLALAEARTQREAAILQDQLQGALRRELMELIQAAQTHIANKPHSATHTLPSEMIERLSQLHSRADLGVHLTRPCGVTLAGPPNVGKSSLINALLGFERAIVFDQPGTTRDVVTALSAWDGWSVELADTAGLGESSEHLECAGMQRAREQLAQSDLVVLVFDQSQPWTVESDELSKNYPGALCVFNKCDLPAGALPGSGADFIRTSARTGLGLEQLATGIIARLVPNVPGAGAAVPFTSDQQHAISTALTTWQSGNAAAGIAELEKLLVRRSGGA